MRYHKYIFTLLFASFIFCLWSQESISELANKFNKSTDAHEKIELGLSIAELHFDLYNDSMLYYTAQVKEIALATNDQKSMTSALKLDVKHYKVQRNYLNAIESIQQAINISQEISDQRNVAILKDELADIFIRQGKYSEAVILMEDALQVFKEQKDSSLIFLGISNLARMYNDRNRYPEADAYHRQALKYAITQENKGVCLANIGINFKHQNEFDSAKLYYAKGLEMNPHDIYFKMRTYHNLALIEKRIGNKQKALNYQDQVVKLAGDVGDFYKASNAKVNKTFIYYDLGLFNKAEQILNEEEAMIRSKGTIQEKMDYHLIRYNIAIELNKANNAIQYYKDYRKIVDSLNNIELNTRIAEFETKYKTSEKERLLVVKDQELQKSNQMKKLLMLGIAGLLWFGLFGILYFWSRNKFNKRLAAKELILQEERIAQLKQEKKILSISSILEGQEQERVRIAQDLHDSIGGLLTTVKIHFGEIQKELEKIATINIGENVEKLIDEASTEVRRISHNMAPRSLSLSGLQAAMSDLASEIQSATAMKVEFEWNGKGVNLEQSKEITIYRILQELCNNALKHSKAENLLIQVNNYEGKFNLLVEDDGVGFDYAQNKTNGGIGLQGISSRVELVNGTLDIDSAPNKGTSITITI